jgi:hypothetical protein
MPSLNSTRLFGARRSVGTTGAVSAQYAINGCALARRDRLDGAHVADSAFTTSAVDARYDINE